MPKRVRFSAYAKLENTCLDLLALSIEAAFSSKEKKRPILEQARIKTEIIKRLVRILYDTSTIQEKPYFSLQTILQEISKMINGWIKYLA